MHNGTDIHDNCLNVYVCFFRYKDGSGDPSALFAYLRHNKIQPNIFLRYVGNRIHVMFKMAATIFCHRTILTEFLRTRNARELCRNIHAGLTDLSIQIQLQVLGLFSKYLTGPWMKMFYRREDGTRYVEVVCIAFILRNKLCTVLTFSLIYAI